MFCIKWFDRISGFSDHPGLFDEGNIFECIFCEEVLKRNCILKEHMWLLRMLYVFNGIYLWMFVEGNNKKFYWNSTLVYPVKMCLGKKSVLFPCEFEISHGCFVGEKILFYV